MRKFIVDGSKVSRLRKDLPDAPSQRTLAERIGVHYVTLANIENGKYGASAEMVAKLATALGVKPDDIAKEKHYKLLERASSETDLGEILDYLIEHPTERKLVLKAVRAAKSHKEAVQSLAQTHRLRHRTT
ncbi:MAG TPA: helix-turn-helix transcriptional regulator [Elusimicrobiales bacterium]|nr:helix-turn-helix transcriptional regulator [Elusimicrobiales bacterium]